MSAKDNDDERARELRRRVEFWRCVDPANVRPMVGLLIEDIERELRDIERRVARGTDG